MKFHLTPFLFPALIVGLNLMPTGRATAQTYKILHRFDGNEGSNPMASLILSNNTLYGTAGGGGPENGTVFAINSDGSGFTTLRGFTAGGTDSSGAYTNSGGADLEAGLVLSGSTLYGTAASGDSLGHGTVFAIGTNGTRFTTLHGFAGYPGDGANPQAGLAFANNTLYGTAAGGGSSGLGTLFAINTDGTGFTNLHTFTAGANNSTGYYTNSDGVSPYARLLLSGNTLYGTAVAGGSSGFGTVFAVNTDGTGFTNLHSFAAASGSGGEYGTNSDGGYPHAGLLLSGNALYGTASSGGSSGFGTLFVVNTDGTGFRTLHSFTATSGSGDIYDTNSDGAFPWAGLILSGNTLYGTAVGGGGSGYGTVFAINTDGTGFTNLHSFADNDGIFPYGGLLLSGNALYGTASDYFNDPRNGTVFSLSFTPQLTITPSGPNAILSWPTKVAGFDYTGYTLESTADLGSSAVWSANSPVPVVVNGQNTVTNPMPRNSRFYRLTRPGPQTWETVANMPTGRDSLGAAADADGRIYAIGGEDASGSGALGTVEAYTPGTPGSWARMASMPTPRSFHAVVAGKDGRIYAMGGLASVGGVLATMEVYTPSTDSWVTGASMPTARAWLSAAAGPDGRIYAIGGGNDSDRFLATVDVYTPSLDSWATATSMPTPRMGFATATTADCLTTYVIGGYSPAGYGLNTVEAFTPNAGAGAWATRAGMPTARFWLGAAAGADGRIYAIGGNNVVFNVATAAAYTPGTDSWVTVPTMPTARSSLAAVGANGRIYAIGGQDGPEAVGEKVEVYTP